jgi:hypothetical protein
MNNNIILNKIKMKNLMIRYKIFWNKQINKKTNILLPMAYKK